MKLQQNPHFMLLSVNITGCISYVFQLKRHPKKTKYKTLLQSIVLPNLLEMLTYLRDNYGEDVFHEYEQLIKENTTW